MGFSGSLMVKNPPAMPESQEMQVEIPGSRRSPGEGNGNPLQYSCLENPLDRGARWVIVHGVVEPDTTDDMMERFTLVFNGLLAECGILG